MNNGDKEFNDFIQAACKLAFEIKNRFEKGITPTEYDFYTKAQAYSKFVIDELEKVGGKVK